MGLHPLINSFEIITKKINGDNCMKGLIDFIKDCISLIMIFVFAPVRAILAIPLYPYVVIRTYIFAIKSFETWKFFVYGWICWFFVYGLFGCAFQLFFYMMFGRDAYDPFAEPYWIFEGTDVGITFVSKADVKRAINWL